MLTEAPFWIGVGCGALGVVAVAGFLLWKLMNAMPTRFM